MAVTKRARSSASESDPKSPAKKRTLNNSNHSESMDSPPVKSSPKPGSARKAARRSDTAVRFRNTLMISEYKEKNPHIAIQAQDDESQFNAEELSPDDDVWIFQAPASMDVSQLTGQTFKLGSRSSAVQVGQQSYEFVTEKFAEPKGMSIICTQKNAQMALVSFVPEGKVLLRTAINGSDEDEPIDFEGLQRDVKVPMPGNLKVRHPLHGFQYEDIIKLDKITKAKLEEAASIVPQKARAKKTKESVKAEKIETVDEVTVKTESVSPKKKSRKRKHESSDEDDEAGTEMPFMSKKAKTTIDTEDGNDLDWIKRL